MRGGEGSGGATGRNWLPWQLSAASNVHVHQLQQFILVLSVAVADNSRSCSQPRTDLTPQIMGLNKAFQFSQMCKFACKWNEEGLR